jgi:hypothetical protein
MRWKAKNKKSKRNSRIKINSNLKSKTKQKII